MFSTSPAWTYIRPTGSECKYTKSVLYGTRLWGVDNISPKANLLGLHHIFLFSYLISNNGHS